MIVTCHSCGSKYTIADDKVRGRRVKVRCKGCGTPIVLEGDQASDGAGPGEQPGEADAEAASGYALPFEEAAAGAGPDAGTTWSVNLSDTDQREMTTDEIARGFASGLVTDDAFVWKDGMADWVAVLEQPELRAAIERVGGAGRTSDVGVVTSAPVAPAQEAGRAAARVAQAQDLFGSVAEAGSENDARIGVAPAATPYSAKPTGARNENSVLFSLDSLKAGMMGPSASAQQAAPAPKPPAGRPRPRAQQPADDPFGMSVGGGLAGIGGGGALFSPDAQALLTAPAPEPPAPKAVAAVGDPADVSFSGAGVGKKKLFVGLGAAAAVLVVLGIVLASGGSDEKVASDSPDAGAAAAQPETAQVPAAAQPQPVAQAQPAATAEAKPEPKAEEKKPEPAAAATKVAAAQPSGATSKASTSTKTAAAPKDETPKLKVKETPSSGLASFSTDAARSALSTAASQATSCKRPDGPTGTGKVTVTFAPSGRVTSANVNGAPFAGTSVGGCVASVFRTAPRASPSRRSQSDSSASGA
jgi:predicted Zn finger-like uncharacterized protein